MTAPQQPGQPPHQPPAIPPVGPIGEPAVPAVCVRHPDRQTSVRCSRCDRPACPECLREAAVGHQCVDCVNEGRQAIRRRWQPSTPAVARSTRTPVIVPSLVAVNVAVYALTAIVAGNPMQNYQSLLFYQLQLVPVEVATGSWWQVITSGFLHYGPLHIAMNMVALWVIGRDLELALGRTRFTAVYLLSLLGGSASVMLFGNPYGPVAGASGAVFGLMGGVLVVVIKLKLNPSSVIGMIAINLVLSFAIPGISVLGHLGGLITGALLTALLVYAPRDRRLAWQLGGGAAVLLIIVAVLAIRAVQLVSLP